MATTAISLYHAQGILTDLLTNTAGVAKCDNCGEELGEETYVLCNGPSDDALGHASHTGCATCATDPLRPWISHGGACKPCLDALGGRRTAVPMAGRALFPPTKNTIANKMIGCCTEAKQKVQAAQEAEDSARRQEGPERRAAAVEDMHRRREEAEKHAQEMEAQAARKAQEVEANAARKAQELEAKAARDAQEVADETKRKAQEAAAAVHASEMRAKQLEADAERKAQEVAADAERKAKEVAEEAARKAQHVQAATAPPPENRKRKQYVMTEEGRINRKAKAEERKQRYEDYPRLEEERDDLAHFADAALAVAREYVPADKLQEFEDRIAMCHP